MEEIIISPNILGRLLGDIEKVVITEEEVSVRYRVKKDKLFRFDEVLDVPTFKVGIFGTGLRFWFDGSLVNLMCLNRRQVKCSIDAD